MKIHKSGKLITPTELGRAFKSALTKYNKNHKEKLPEIPLYGCRHSFATNNYERGESDKVLSEIMGNSPKTFLAKYAHIRGSRKSQTLDNYVDIIFNSSHEN